ncbi:MAG TPA: hypothetical protein VFC78_21795, partial [Tepidisphaeraceae bacterium]|nr:hypothetical protein [Tepidisphaeraceae bacterium]
PPATAPTTAPASQPADVSRPARPPRFFDALAHYGRPNSVALGLKPLFMVYEPSLWPRPPRDDGPPAESLCRTFARQAGLRREMVCIDIEKWPIDIRVTPRAQVEQNLRKLAQIADWFHDERPDLRIGFYGIAPITDFWTPYNYHTALRLKATSPYWASKEAEYTLGFEGWQRSNDFVRERLGRHIDVLFPSLYQFYDDINGWDIYARANVAEADRYGKAVFPFIWFRYHPNTEALHNKLIPVDQWTRQLELTTRLSEGPVIWGGYKETWDPNQPWWQATARFMQADRAGIIQQQGHANPR